eukprot:2554188-Pleurochrysis_carterae.AAC.2
MFSDFAPALAPFRIPVLYLTFGLFACFQFHLANAERVCAPLLPVEIEADALENVHRGRAEIEREEAVRVRRLCARKAEMEDEAAAAEGCGVDAGAMEEEEEEVEEEEAVEEEEEVEKAGEAAGGAPGLCGAVRDGRGGGLGAGGGGGAGGRTGGGEDGCREGEGERGEGAEGGGEESECAGGVGGRDAGASSICGNGVGTSKGGSAETVVGLGVQSPLPFRTKGLAGEGGDGV